MTKVQLDLKASIGKARAIFVIALALCLPVLTPAQTRRALLIANGEYQKNTEIPVKPLAAPPSDVRMMTTLLRMRYDFQPRNMTLIGLKKEELGSEFGFGGRYATSKAITEGLAALLQSAAPNDYIVIYISGHGWRVPDPALRKPSLNNEVLITYEATRSSLIFDDDIKSWLNKFHAKGVKNVTIILDTCYSGGLTKDPSQGTYAPFKDFDVEFDWTGKSLGIGEKKDTEASALLEKGDPKPDFYALLAACQENETTMEIKDKRTGQAFSVFTQALYQVLMRVKSPLNSAELKIRLKEHLRVNMPRSAFQNQPTQRVLQTPVVVKGNEARDLIAPWVAIPTAAIGAVQAKSDGSSCIAWRVIETLPDATILIEGGILAGIREGMQFTAKTKEGHALIAKVTSVGWFNSQLQWENGSFNNVAYVYSLDK